MRGRSLVKNFVIMVTILNYGPSLVIASEAPAPKKNLDSGPQVVTSDNFDFDEQPIDGTMRMPAGSFLQGRQAQRMKSMLKLRTNFKDRIMDPQKVVQ